MSNGNDISVEEVAHDIITALNDAGHHITRNWQPVIESTLRSALSAESGEAVAFGHGDKVVNWGTYGVRGAVFIAPAKQPGAVGEDASRERIPRNALVPGEIVLTFPTEEQAARVADALMNKAAPAAAAPAPVADAVKEADAKGFHEGILVCLMHIAGHDIETLYSEIVRAVGVENLIKYATQECDRVHLRYYGYLPAAPTAGEKE